MEKTVKEEFRESRDNNDNNNNNNKNHKRIDHEEKAKEELRRGLAAANQLRVLVAESKAGHCLGWDEATLQAHMKDHSSIILSSFDSAISILKRIASRENKDGGDNTGISLISSDNGNKRSYYNRRTTQPEPVKTITSVTATEDGYTWRKYGQKPIVNAKYPREYYRCGHKDEVGCPATKQVQMNDENPNKYIITYYGNHTCQARLGHNRNASQLHALMEGSTPEDKFANTNMLNFECNSSNKLSFTPAASSPGKVGLNPLSKIFSSLSASAPTTTSLNKEKVIVISPDKEKLFINVPNDHQFEPPTLSSDKALLNMADLVMAMETPPAWYSSYMFSPESNDVAVPVEDDYYCSLFADCDDHQFEGRSQDNLHHGEQ